MRRPLCLLCLIYVLAVILILQWIPLKNERAGLPGEGSRFTLQGRVDRIEYQKNKSVLYLKNCSGRVLCYFQDISFVSTLKIRNEVCVTGKVRRFEAPSNEGQFDEKQYYEVLGIDFALWDCSGIITDERSNIYRQMLYTSGGKGRNGCRNQGTLPSKRDCSYPCHFRASYYFFGHGFSQALQENQDTCGRSGDIVL